MLRVCSEELLKVAKTRYEREIERGVLSRADIAPELGKHELPSILGTAQRKRTREMLAAPASVGEGALAHKRRMAGKLYGAQASSSPNVHKVLGFMMGPASGGEHIVAGPQSGAFLRKVTSGPLGKYRAVGGTLSGPIMSGVGTLEVPVSPKVKSVLERISKASLGKASPQDSTLTHAILRHELGERASTKGKLYPVSSHFGPKPILEEQMALRGDPEAIATMGKARAMHQDDALVQRLVRQAGGTPDAPLPIGGKHERAVERMITRRVGELHPTSRSRAFQLSGAHEVGYMPKGVNFLSVTEPASKAGVSLAQRKYREALSHAREAAKTIRRAGTFIRLGR